MTITRRNFLKTTGAAGAGLTVLTQTGVVFGTNTRRPVRVRPILLNSHGDGCTIATEHRLPGVAELIFPGCAVHG